MAFYAHCDKCDHFVVKRTLERVQTCKATHSSPAEYEDWCEVCRGGENPREKGDDDGVEYADPRDYRDGLE